MFMHVYIKLNCEFVGKKVHFLLKKIQIKKKILIISHGGSDFVETDEGKNVINLKKKVNQDIFLF